MNAKQLIGTPAPSTFTNQELAERIQKLEAIVSRLSDRLSEIDGKDFYIHTTTRGNELVCLPKDTIPPHYEGV